MVRSPCARMSALTAASRGGRSLHILSPMAFANALPAAVGGILKPGEATCVQPLRTVAASPSALAAPPTNDLLVSDIWLPAPRAMCAIEPNASTCSHVSPTGIDPIRAGLPKYFSQLPNVTILNEIWHPLRVIGAETVWWNPTLRMWCASVQSRKGCDSCRRYCANAYVFSPQL